MDDNPFKSPQVKPSAPARDLRRTFVWILAIVLAASPFALVGVAAAGVILQILSNLGLEP
jgi:hypothetical protein